MVRLKATQAKVHSLQGQWLPLAWHFPGGFGQGNFCGMARAMDRKARLLLLGQGFLLWVPAHLPLLQPVQLDDLLQAVFTA